MNEDISIESYIHMRMRLLSSEPESTRGISAFAKMISQSFEFSFINSNPKGSYGYERHAQELYRQLNAFYSNLSNSQYSQDLYQIINYIICSGNIAPQFCTKFMVEFLKNRILELYVIQGQLHMSIPMVKDLCGNKYIMYLILQYMVDTFTGIQDFSSLFSVLNAVGEDVKSLLLGWKENAHPVYKDSADLLIKAYRL